MLEYKPKYFTIYELVHRWIIAKIGITNSWLRLDSGALRDLDKIREKWGSGIVINSGRYDSRGYRPPNDPDGAWNSTHKHGNTFDLVPSNGNYEGLYNMISNMISNSELEAFNTLEDVNFTPGWVHCAKMNTTNRPLVIKP